VYTTPFASPEQCRERRRALDEACRQLDRDPDSLPLSLMTLTVVGADRGDVRNRLGRVLELLGDARPVDEVLAHEHDAWLVGTVDHVAERLDAYRAAGVSRAMLQHIDHTDDAMVALIAGLADS
jgi:alkanesulfonate monooxygenase SsuD/methylene tetrahydromethanopterin reductase-like flavin-dependent oxidoreductase (luciferase family)